MQCPENMNTKVMRNRFPFLMSYYPPQPQELHQKRATMMIKALEDPSYVEGIRSLGLFHLGKKTNKIL